MSVSPELMAQMQKGLPPGMGPPGGQMPPVSSPMSTPQPNEGEKQGAMTQVQMAMDILERSLPAFGSESEEGSTVIDALAKLGKRFGGAQRAKSKEMMPSEIMNMVASLPKGPMGAHPIPPGAGGPPPGISPPAPSPMQPPA